jgi:ribonucleotide monophosphatase NagD (HAD superfamily)
MRVRPAPGQRVLVSSGRDVVPVEAEAELQAGSRIQLGGTVLEIGKPDAAVYGPTLALLGDTPKHRVVAVGDTAHTDLAGAMAAGLDSLWAMTGLFQHAHGADVSVPEIRRLAEAEHVTPIAALRGLRV